MQQIYRWSAVRHATYLGYGGIDHYPLYEANSIGQSVFDWMCDSRKRQEIR